MATEREEASLQEPNNFRSITAIDFATDMACLVTEKENNEVAKTMEMEKGADPGKNKGVDSVGVKYGVESSGVRSMDISPQVNLEAQTNQVQSVQMIDAREDPGTGSKNYSISLASGKRTQPSCKRTLFPEAITEPNLVDPITKCLQAQNQINKHVSETQPQNLCTKPTYLEITVNPSPSSTNPPENTSKFPITELNSPQDPDLFKLPTPSPNYQFTASSIPSKQQLEFCVESIQRNTSFKRRRLQGIAKTTKQHQVEGENLKKEGRKREREETIFESARVYKKRRMKIVINCDIIRGKMGMEKEDQEHVNQKRLDKLIRMLKGYKSISTTDDEKAEISREMVWLKEKKFSFGKSLTADGVPIEEEIEDDYAVYLLIYGIPGEEDDDSNKEEEQGATDTNYEKNDGIEGLVLDSGISGSTTDTKSSNGKKEGKQFAVVPEKPPSPRC